MRRKFFAFIVAFLGAGAAVLFSQEVQDPPEVRPAATRSQADCTGFISSQALPNDLFVAGGEDDDMHSPVRQFVPGKSVFVASRGHQSVAVGAEYSVVRPAKVIFSTERYAHQSWALRKLGEPYEDIGQVKVTHVNPAGIVAQVAFACTPIVPGDILVPFQPRPIPEYVVTKPLDHFAPLDANKLEGEVVGARDNFGFLRHGNIVYLNLGEDAGIKPGNRFRVFKVLPARTTGWFERTPAPPEILGEAVVLSVQPKACVAIVVGSYREISSGDAVQLE